MIDDPDRWAPPYAEAGAHNVTVHAEAAHDPRQIARDLRAAGAKAGLSVKPNTPLEDWLEVLRDYDTLLIMSVEPGFGGQSFMPEVLDKVRTARRLVDTGHLTVLVEIDGGIGADTVEAGRRGRGGLLRRGQRGLRRRRSRARGPGPARAGRARLPAPDRAPPAGDPARHLGSTPPRAQWFESRHAPPLLTARVGRAEDDAGIGRG